MVLVVSLSLLLIFEGFMAVAFEWSSDAGHRPQLDRRAMAGVWKLTPVPPVKIPMKEFTVYPKKPNPASTGDEGFLLMLKEDGSFQQYAPTNNDNDEEDEEDSDLNKSWLDFQSKQKLQQLRAREQQLLNLAKGVWDYRDGKLILAADRPEKSKITSFDEPRSRLTTIKTTGNEDTLLEGEVVATYNERLLDNPVTSQVSNSEEISAIEDVKKDSTKSSKFLFDTHLSVPIGSINIGKFFYPKKHPSFFEQPMFQPVKQGTFKLRQILGSLNTAQELNDSDDNEKFQRSDFYNKTFLLTTHPISQRIPKGNMRWSIKQNKYVHDKQSKTSSHEADSDESPTRFIRVMQVKFFNNNTFSSTGGLGRDVILRGKYDVIGEFKDHLWFQVVRFGFGRSVSGSVYSEGRMLSQDDAKAYWGKISLKKDISFSNEKNQIPSDLDSVRNIEVDGSVMDGWGLEPIPVARFIMREDQEGDDVSLYDDDDIDSDADDVDGYEGDVITLFIDEDEAPGVDGIDWSGNKEEDVFQ